MAPGAIDMKGGITVATWAIRGLVERSELPRRPIWLLMTSDEEVGSIYSGAIDASWKHSTLRTDINMTNRKEMIDSIFRS